jgi:peptidyl-prolyl cis-trans isomerase D
MRGLAKYIWVFVALVFVGGFLLYETSGLMGRTPVTATTAVAVVNGHELSYRDYLARVQSETQAAQQREGRTLSQDDTRRIENAVFDQMVSEVLLQDQYRQRGIFVTDDEVREFARYAPPPWITNAPELQTDGRFDPEKYQRLLGSAQARQSGLLLQLEAYYRGEIPREKLLDQIASGAYASDEELWRAWRDQHDSAQVSFVAFSPSVDTNTVKSISDADLRTYFDQHSADFESPGMARVTVVTLPRVVGPADSAAAKAKAQQLREEIVKGAKFEDVAKRESADTVSGAKGGDLGPAPKTRYVAEFSKAADALKVGEISQPVLTQFGYHIIRLDSRKGDTLSLHHILLRVTQSDSAATRIDREADALSRLAAQSEQGSKLDSAAKELHLQEYHLQAIEDSPVILNGQMVPSVSAWAFGGAKVGETSELFDDDNGYYLARLDSLHEGGSPKFENVKDAVRQRVAAIRAVDQVMPKAQKLASDAAGSSLEAAAQANGVKVQQSQMFARGSLVPGIGQFNEAIGAAFKLPVGAVSQPVRTEGAAIVLRVDKRTMSDSAAWAAQKAAQRTARLQQLRDQRIQIFMSDLRKAAKIDDRRKAINASVRRQEA